MFRDWCFRTWILSASRVVKFPLFFCILRGHQLHPRISTLSLALNLIHTVHMRQWVMDRLENQVAGISLLPLRGTSICNQPCLSVSPAEPRNSAVWLMLQPHPLDQRDNYIVINVAEWMDFRCQHPWLLFIKYHSPEKSIIYLPCMVSETSSK